MMDLGEARACLDEHRILLAAISEMLKPNVAKGEAGQAIGKFDDGLVETLNSQLKDAVILSILIWEEIKETPEQIVDFLGEGADLVEALNQLKLAIDKATQAQAEYLRKTALNEGNAQETVHVQSTAKAVNK